MKGRILLIIAMFFLSLQLNAQHGWTVNPAAYANSGDVNAIVLLDGVEMTTGALGAFVGETCRGFDEVATLFPPSGYMLFQFLIYSNVSGETMTFKYYNEGDGLIYDVTESIVFVIDENYGDAFFPVVLNAITNASPVVSSPIADQILDEHFSSATISLASVFSDADLDALTYSATSSSGSVVSVSVSGTDLIITEAGLGVSTITVTADDGLATVDDVFTVTVNNVNDAPLVVNPIADRSPNEGFGSITISLTSVFNDPDGTALTYSAGSSAPGVVTVSVSGATLTITEVANGVSTITVTASDGVLSVDNQFLVTVNNVNDAPVVSAAIPDQVLDEHFASMTIDLSTVFTDPDGDVLTLTPVSSNPIVVSAGITGSILTITEVGLGNSTISITASDGSLSVVDAFLVTVNNVNDAPVVNIPVPNQNEFEHFNSTIIDLSGTFTDPDGDAITISPVSSNPGVVTVSIIGTALTVTEVGNGVSTITLTASDGSLTRDDVFTFTVTNVNDAPFVANPVADQILDEHFNIANIDLSAVFLDPDGTVLTLTPVSSNPTVVTVGISGTNLTLNEVGLGTSTITVTASDGSLSVNDVFTVTVNNVNDPPIVTSAIPDQNLFEHFGSTVLNLASTFNDPDGNVLTLTAVSSAPAIAGVSVSGTNLTITELGLGTATITVTASDGTLSVNDVFSVTINNVNDAPQVTNPIADVVLSEHFISSTVDLSGVFTDPDGTALILTPLSSNPAVVTVGISGNILTITEVGVGSATITVTASDGSLTINDAFIVTVNNVNDAPLVVNPVANQSMNEHFTSTTINISTVFSDPDGTALTLTSLSSDVSVVNVSISGSTLTITEVGLGVSTITLTASDGSLSVNEQFTFTVVDVNDAPIVASPVPNQNLNEHFVSQTINLVGVFSDPDGNPLTLSAVSSNTAVVTVGISGTLLTLTEVGNGTATITLTASDGLLSVNDQFIATVINVNDPPVVAAPIPDLPLNEHFILRTISLSGVFNDPDGTTLSLSAVSSNNLVATVAVSGNSLIITEAGIGTTTITVSASDGSLSVDDEFLVTVTNVNDPPLVVSPLSNLNLVEHFNVRNVALSGVFNDPDGDAITLSAVSSNPGIVTVSVSGTTLLITEVGLGTSTITVTGSDGTLATDDDFTVTVNNVNDAPIVTAPISSISNSEGFGTTTINLFPVFTDPDDDALSYSAVSSNPSVVSVSVSGTILTISEGVLGSSTITVTATDGSLSTIDQFNVTINNVNDQPEVVSPIANRNYDEGFGSATINLSSVFSDPDGDVLSFSLANTNSGVVSVNISGTTLTITEVGLGSTDITVTASDGSLSVDDVFTVSVSNVNDAPVVANPIADQSFAEYFGSTTINLSGTFSDPDGNPLTLSAISSNNGIVTVSVSGSTLTINEVGIGISIITVTATDGILSVNDQFSLTVSNVNDPPIVVGFISNRVFDEGFGSSTISLAPIFSDPDGDVLTRTATSSNTSAVTVNVTGTILTITEVGLGVSTITVTASDGSLSVNTQFTVTVNNVNDPPIVSNPIPDRALNEHFTTSTVDLSAVFSDPDGNPLTLTATSSESGVVTVSVSGTTLTINEVGMGTSIITVIANDGSLTVSDVFNVVVSNVNDAPEVVNSIADRNLNEHFGSITVSLAGVFSDPDGDGLTLSASTGNPSVVSVSLSGTVLTINEVGLGTTTITISASDGSLSADEQFTVLVTNVNDTPLVAVPLANQTYNEHFTSTVIDISGTFSDPDGDALTLTALSSNTAIVSVSVSGTELTITEEGLGTCNITLTASDGSLTVNDVFTVTVNNVNDAPFVQNAIADRVLNEHFITQTIGISAVFGDPDGDVLSYTAVSGNSAIVSVSISGSNLVITEAGLGTSTITLTANDGLLSVSDVFTVTVNNVNDAPVVANAVANRNLNEHFGSITINLNGVFVDPDSDPLTLTAVSGNAGVVGVSLSGNILTVSELGLGNSTITVTASDGTLTVEDQFTITVTNVNDVPEIDNPLSNRELDEHFSTLAIDLTAVFSDPDGDALSYTVVSGDPGVVSVAVSGTTLTLTEIGLGISTISVTASDGSLSVSDQFTVRVNNVNDAPVVETPLGDLSKGEQFGTLTIDLSGVFSDPDGDALSLSVLSSNTGVVTVSLSGLSLLVTEVAKGTSTISITATDGTLSTIETFEMSIDDVNFAPTVETVLADMEIPEHSNPSVLDLTGVFNDPDGDNLTLSVESSNPGVVSAEISGLNLTLTEVALGSATITISATDGEFSVDTDFMLTFTNVNDAPVVDNPVDDQKLVEGFSSLDLDLTSVFVDPDGDDLTLSAVSMGTDILTVSMLGSLLTITEAGIGSTKVVLTASDSEFSITDTLEVVIEKRNNFSVFLGDRELNSLDTVLVCNDADEIYFDIKSDIAWNFGTPPSWMALDITNDSMLTIGYSQNLTGDDRIDSIRIIDAQNHVIQLVMKQTENCIPDGIADDFYFDLDMYPNPVNEVLFINISNEIQSQVRLELFDNSGKLLYNEDFKYRTGRTIQLEMSSYSEGLYFIRISDDKHNVIRKIVKL